MFFIKIIYAILGIALGFGMLKYRKIVYSWTGKFYWAEKYIGSGGTVFIIILTGLGLIFVSVVYPFGFFDTPSQYSNSVNVSNNQSPPVE